MAALIDHLTRAAQEGASDLFIIPGAPVSIKIDGKITSIEDEKVMPASGESLIREIYGLANREIEPFLKTGDDDFSCSVPGLARFRVNAYKQRGSFAAVIRVVSFDIPYWEDVHIPRAVMDLAGVTDGMILFTGTAGSGKSTTQACIIDRINRERSCHIVTLEDPIEFLHRNHKSIVSQREISVDTVDCLSALRACLRQAPDVIQLGEMRDLETIRTAMTAAETGHLLMGTLHTKGAVNSIDRIIDAFPADQQSQVRIQLSAVLRTVVSQQLLPDVKGGQVPAFEILHMTSAVRSMIRDCKSHQVPAAIASGTGEGMLSMDQSILDLLKKGCITKTTALEYADNPDQMARRIESL
ncbi:MAG: PilT/PilU family type 4a pilus ATPase [Firmicutes bacterium]|nr:PilT/PilU family type 4a pilus ATPase [Bacillota bacterium]